MDSLKSDSIAEGTVENLTMVQNVQNIPSDVDHQALELTKNSWRQEQDNIKKQVILTDSLDFKTKSDLLVGGLDISFIVGDDRNACACYVVMDTSLKVVYQACGMVELTSPYIPGYLAFREAGFLCQLVNEQRELSPQLTPHLIMIDGNGILHPHRAGIACHIGILLQLPTVGVAKNLHLLPDEGELFTRGLELTRRLESISSRGESLLLVTDSGEILGAAVKTTEKGKNPVFVSVGSGISLDSALHVVTKFSVHRIPEPTRQADIISREYLRIHHPTERQLQPRKKDKKIKT